MPIYEYRRDGEQSGSKACALCGEGFTVLQKISAAPLERCPQCTGPVRRVISAPNVVRGQAHLLKPANAEKAGFTQYRKIGKGVYEKTAGKGPKIIQK